MWWIVWSTLPSLLLSWSACRPEEAGFTRRNITPPPQSGRARAASACPAGVQPQPPARQGLSLPLASRGSASPWPAGGQPQPHGQQGLSLSLLASRGSASASWPAGVPWNQWAGAPTPTPGAPETGHFEVTCTRSHTNTLFSLVYYTTIIHPLLSFKSISFEATTFGSFNTGLFPGLSIFSTILRLYIYI